MTTVTKSNDNRKSSKPHGGKIRKDTNLTRKTDAKTGYKHGQFSNKTAKKP
jgi:hypothetical protein